MVRLAVVHRVSVLPLDRGGTDHEFLAKGRDRFEEGVPEKGFTKLPRVK